MARRSLYHQWRSSSEVRSWSSAGFMGSFLPYGRGECGTGRIPAVAAEPRSLPVRKNAAMDSTQRTARTEPGTGRIYSTRRIVRSTDVTPSGRLRLDALARYLQIVAEDDVADSGL